MRDKKLDERAPRVATNHAVIFIGATGKETPVVVTYYSKGGFRLVMNPAVGVAGREPNGALQRALLWRQRSPFGHPWAACRPKGRAVDVERVAPVLYVGLERGADRLCRVGLQRPPAARSLGKASALQTWDGLDTARPRASAARRSYTQIRWITRVMRMLQSGSKQNWQQAASWIGWLL